MERNTYNTFILSKAGAGQGISQTEIEESFKLKGLYPKGAGQLTSLDASIHCK